MNVILYMATTINGFIAKENDSTPWSDEEWEVYAAMTKKIGNIIIGMRTYGIMKDDGFDKIGNPFVVVITRRKNNTDTPNVVFVESPEQALKVLEKKGYQEAMVNGGSTIINLFVQKNLIDEIYLDVEPFVFGKGKSLFLPGDFELALRLEEVKKIGENSIQVHYKLKK